MDMRVKERAYKSEILVVSASSSSLFEVSSGTKGKVHLGRHFDIARGNAVRRRCDAAIIVTANNGTAAIYGSAYSVKWAFSKSFPGPN